MQEKGESRDQILSYKSRIIKKSSFCCKSKGNLILEIRKNQEEEEEEEIDPLTRN
jgi:hypothetical protein